MRAGERCGAGGGDGGGVAAVEVVLFAADAAFAIAAVVRVARAAAADGSVHLRRLLMVAALLLAVALASGVADAHVRVPGWHLYLTRPRLLLAGVHTAGVAAILFLMRFMAEQQKGDRVDARELSEEIDLGDAEEDDD
jgi:hypothetical protein